MDRIPADAYQALRDALASITWYKQNFRRVLHALLRDQPQLIVGLDFESPKREVADQLVDRLLANEAVLRSTTTRLIVEVSAFDHFPDIERLQEPDRTERLTQAVAAVGVLRNVMTRISVDRAKLDAEGLENDARAAQEAALRRFDDDVRSLRERFLALESSTRPHERGYALERLLADLFELFDMEPRLAYSANDEQIDGSLRFDTDDYIVESKWVKEPISRATADVFAEKVRRKAKNALGLFIAVNGFAATALERYRESTPFLTMDGADLFAVLDGRIRLDELMKAKRRHANETGSCYMPVSRALAR